MPRRRGLDAHDLHAFAVGFVVRNKDEQLVLGSGTDKRKHLRVRLLVQRAEGLVHQQDIAVISQRSCQRGAALHAAGERIGIAVFFAGKADEFKPMLSNLTIWTDQEYVLQHCLPRKETVFLKAERDAHILRQRDLAGERLFKPGYQAQQRCLAPTGRTENGIFSRGGKGEV